MLELKNIKKIYETSGETVEALKGISLHFDDSEFVSVLGPSGCGKTTLLNIIGGLDHATEGELIINGRCTGDYHDRDWDTYRNHSVGFVFQSYNLIPHQTVLQNVELALSLSGIGHTERKKRAIEALKTVGLSDQLKKRPSEMSGGQMQRVAIARAIVNNPDIILADEPTGALDTETSVQVMNILKKISENKLVIMVTHNPDLAEKYSTRIVRMLDGKITDDIQKSVQSVRHEKKSDVNTKRASMSMRTGFGLSLKNLITKKGRTLLTCFAGSIGIIGIALIYAVSNGMNGYINRIQEETLSSYPLTLEGKQLDTSSFISTFLGKAKSLGDHDDDGVYQKGVIFELTNAMNSMEEKQNDLKSFRKFLETQTDDEESVLHRTVSAVQYSYNLSLPVYTKSIDGNIIRSDIQDIMTELIGGFMNMDTSLMSSMAGSSIMGSNYSMMESYNRLWQEILPGEDAELIHPLFMQEYELVYGSWPSRYDEVVLILDEKGEISDLALYALGLIPQEDMIRLMSAAATREQIEFTPRHWTYEEICSMDFRIILDSDSYVSDEMTGKYTDLRNSPAGMQYLYDNGLKIHISGILKPSGNSVSAMLKDGIGYTSALTDFMINSNNTSVIVNLQISMPNIDVLTGLPFRNAENMSLSQKAFAFREISETLGNEKKAAAYRIIKSVPDDSVVSEKVNRSVGMMKRKDMEEILLPIAVSQMGMPEETVRGYLVKMDDNTLTEWVCKILTEQYKQEITDTALNDLDQLTDTEIAEAFDRELPTLSDELCASCYDSILEFSDSDYESNLMLLGYIDPESPSSIHLYAASFEDKELIEKEIRTYNQSVDPMSEITYVDYVGLMMSSITTIINAISYVLIAFVAISLIVSSIMIGVITLISVQERTKEIGILRSLGASKRNISVMFNAETVMIGFASGVFGVTLTWLLCIPINSILHKLTGINSLSAYLDPLTAGILILISVLLTLLAGIIPSRSASKKDPVEALRTE